MSVLITGAASGLGAALTNLAIKRGHSVTGIDHDWTSLEKTHPENLLQINADLSDLKTLVGLSATISAQAPYKAVFHNAAVSASGRFEDIPSKAHQRLIDINVTAPLLMTQKLLQQGALERGSTFIFIASLSVQVGYPGAASYAASKATIANYAQSLRKALRREGINVLVVYPGPMQTAQAERHAPIGAKSETRMDAKEAADLIWEAVDKGKKELIPGATNRLFAIAGKLMPSALNRAMRKIIYEKLDGSVY
ncbi:MAG: SDR family NAD(P)-dependent oxidoreductase [Hyphomicrobiales bacterium]